MVDSDGLICGRCPSRANCPDRFVGDRHSGQFFRSQVGQCGAQLFGDDGIRAISFAFFEGFSDAEDGLVQRV